MLITERWQKVISTHSLTRRLTRVRKSLTASLLYFNSQPHKEADNGMLTGFNGINTFQLTASQGG